MVVGGGNGREAGYKNLLNRFACAFGVVAGSLEL